MNGRSVSALLLLGGGGHAQVVFEAFRSSGYTIEAVVEKEGRNRELVRTFANDVPTLDEESLVDRYPPESVVLANGIGPRPDKRLRWELARKFRDMGYKFAGVTHASACLAPDTICREGVQIMAGSVIQPGVHIGQDSVINTSASIDHDCVIGSCCHLAPGTVLCGGVTIGDEVFVGAGSVVLENVCIGKGAIIGAGTLVRKNVADGERCVA